MSEETTCDVSPKYFAEDDPFADFIVHEAAHIFHNCKRRTIGLRETRRKEWLLDIEFGRRETFASDEKVERDAAVLANAKEGSSIRDRPAPVELPHDREDSLEMFLVARRHRLAARPEVK